MDYLAGSYLAERGKTTLQDAIAVFRMQLIIIDLFWKLLLSLPEIWAPGSWADVTSEIHGNFYRIRGLMHLQLVFLF